MTRFDISGTLDGIEWMPVFDRLADADLPVEAVVRCGLIGRDGRRCGRAAGYRVVTAPGGLEVLVGSRALDAKLMSDEAAQHARDRRATQGRHGGTWLGHVAIPLDGPAGGPVVLTSAIRNAAVDWATTQKVVMHHPVTGATTETTGRAFENVHRNKGWVKVSESVAFHDPEPSWHGWLRKIAEPRWATRVTADCGKHTSAVHVADVITARAQLGRKVYTRPLPTIAD